MFFQHLLRQSELHLIQGEKTWIPIRGKDSILPRKCLPKSLFCLISIFIITCANSSVCVCVHVLVCVCIIALVFLCRSMTDINENMLYSFLTRSCQVMLTLGSLTHMKPAQIWICSVHYFKSIHPSCVCLLQWFP